MRTFFLLEEKKSCAKEKILCKEKKSWGKKKMFCHFIKARRIFLASEKNSVSRAIDSTLKKNNGENSWF